MNSAEAQDRTPAESPPRGDSPGADLKSARKRAAFSIFLNLLLAIGKGTAGVMSNSAALIGDAIHSATDVIASAAAYTGLWIAGKRHPSFPYGLYKAETIATLAISVAVMIAGYEIGRRAMLGPAALPDVGLALPTALVSLLVSVSFGLYQLRSGKRLHSKALEADARDYLADGMSTAVVIVGLAGSYFGYHLDHWAAGGVAVFVFWSGGHLLWRALRDLMDEAIDRDTEREIVDRVLSYPRVERVERCLSRTAGGRFILDIDVVFRSHSLELAHRTSHMIEDDILKRHPRVVMVSIRTHSHDPSHFRRVTPVKEPKGAVEGRFARAPWFLLETIDTRSGEIHVQEYIQNPYLQARTRRGYRVGRWLLDFKPDQVVVLEEKEGTALSLLKESGVEVVVHDTPLRGAAPGKNSGDGESPV